MSIFAAENCAPKMNLQQFTEILYRTRQVYFPELEREKIGISTFRSDAYFLQAQPEVKTLMGKKAKRKYNVQLNLKLLDCPPDEASLEAILVHELEHIKDYVGWSAAKILKHGLHYVSSLKFRAKYERETDMRVLKKGLNSGLAAYREWVYQWLTPKDYQIKRYIYLTPEEILSDLR